MNLMTDFAFKRLFGSPKRKHILIKFLNILFQKHGLSVYDVVYHDKEVLPEDIDGKRIIYDVYCTTPEDKEHIIVEMQQVYHPAFEHRSVLYAIKTLANQINSGDDYTKVRPVYAIFMTDFDLPNMSPTVLRNIHLADDETHQIFSNLLHLMFVSLKQTKHTWEECENEFDKLLFLIKNMHKMDKNSKAYKSKEYEELFRESEIDRMACEDVVAYSQSELKLKEIQESFEWSRASGFSEGYKEGIEKGIEEGIEKGREEGIEKGREEGILIALRRTATEMLKNNIPPQMVRQFVNLPEEEINNLLNSINPN